MKTETEKREERSAKRDEVLKRIEDTRREHYERHKIGNIGNWQITEDLRSLLDHAVAYIKEEKI